MVEGGWGQGQTRVVIQTLEGKLGSSRCLRQVAPQTQGAVHGADTPVDGLSKTLRSWKQKSKPRGQVRLLTELCSGREVNCDPFALESHQWVASRNERCGMVRRTKQRRKSSLMALFLPKT